MPEDITNHIEHSNTTAKSLEETKSQMIGQNSFFLLVSVNISAFVVKLGPIEEHKI